MCLAVFDSLDGSLHFPIDKSSHEYLCYFIILHEQILFNSLIIFTKIRGAFSFFPFLI